MHGLLWQLRKMALSLTSFHFFSPCWDIGLTFMILTQNCLILLPSQSHCCLRHTKSQTHIVSDTHRIRHTTPQTYSVSDIQRLRHIASPTHNVSDIHRLRHTASQTHNVSDTASQAHSFSDTLRLRNKPSQTLP